MLSLYFLDGNYNINVRTLKRAFNSKFIDTCHVTFQRKLEISVLVYWKTIENRVTKEFIERRGQKLMQIRFQFQLA